MRIGYRWLLATAAGMALAAPGRPCFAQVDATTPGRSGPGTRTGQIVFQKPAPIRPGQPISVLVFPFGYGTGEEMMPAAPADPNAAPAPDANAPQNAPQADPNAAPTEDTPAPVDGMPPAAVTGMEPTSGLSTAQQLVSDLLTAAVKAGFLSTPAFTVTSYRQNASLVQRALHGNILQTDMLSGLVAAATGSADTDRARLVTHRLGIQTLLVGNIELKTDAKANSAEITLDTQLIDSTTGEVLRTAVVSGAATGAEGVPMSAVLERAATDTSLKILPAMGIQLVPITQAAAEQGNGKGKARAAKAADAGAGDKAAERQARKAAREQQRATERAAKEQRERQRQEERARKRNEKNAAPVEQQPPAPEAPLTEPREEEQDRQPARPIRPTPTPPAPGTQPAPGPNVTAPTLGGPTPYRGYSNAAGNPVPYGYALGDSKSAIPPRNRQGLKIPAWLGVAGFLAGISFLL